VSNGQRDGRNAHATRQGTRTWASESSPTTVASTVHIPYCFGKRPRTPYGGDRGDEPVPARPVAQQVSVRLAPDRAPTVPQKPRTRHASAGSSTRPAGPTPTTQCHQPRSRGGALHARSAASGCLSATTGLPTSCSSEGRRPGSLEFAGDTRIWDTSQRAVSEGGLQPRSLGFVPVHETVYKAEPPG
jgi:hypothetical protein